MDAYTYIIIYPKKLCWLIGTFTEPCTHRAIYAETDRRHVHTETDRRHVHEETDRRHAHTEADRHVQRDIYTQRYIFTEHIQRDIYTSIST